MISFLALKGSLHPSFWQLPPLALLIVPMILHQRRRQAFLGMILAMWVFFYGSVHYELPHLGDEKVSGEACLEIHSVRDMASFGAGTFVYRGQIRTFISEAVSAKNVPCSMRVASGSPSADHSYWIKGTLQQNKYGAYLFIPKKGAFWRAIPGSRSLAQGRFVLKQALAKKIKKYFVQPKVADFLVGLVTGDFGDRMASFEFGRFGLQHIMAISGFHFAIVAQILSLAVRFALPRRVASAVIVVFLSGYFLFLGPGISIMRAYFSALVALFAILFNQRWAVLNALGVAMMGVLFVAPLSCQSISFQFSFLVTAAIVVFYRRALALIEKVFQRQSATEIVALNPINQSAYLLFSAIKSALALNIAVNLVAIPAMLFYFHKFPWMSLFYNLFFPFLVSLAVLGLVIAYLFFPLVVPICRLNEIYTQYLLDTVFNMPTKLDYALYLRKISPGVFVLFLCFIFTWGVASYIRHSGIDEKPLFL